jgi:hypothetical protein
MLLGMSTPVSSVFEVDPTEMCQDNLRHVMQRTRQHPFRKLRPRPFEMFSEVVKLRFHVELVVDRMSINSIEPSEDV